MAQDTLLGYLIEIGQGKGVEVVKIIIEALALLLEFLKWIFNGVI